MPPILQNIILVVIILGLLSASCYYIYKEKKKGKRCIGCPMAGECAKAKAQMELRSSKYKDYCKMNEDSKKQS